MDMTAVLFARERRADQNGVTTEKQSFRSPGQPIVNCYDYHTAWDYHELTAAVVLSLGYACKGQTGHMYSSV